MGGDQTRRAEAVQLDGRAAAGAGEGWVDIARRLVGQKHGQGV